MTIKINVKGMKKIYTMRGMMEKSMECMVTVMVERAGVQAPVLYMLQGDKRVATVNGQAHRWNKAYTYYATIQEGSCGF